MPQSYVGKPVISKGIEELYGSLWRLPLGPASWDVSAERARSPMVQREHRISCAARCEAFTVSRRDPAEDHRLGKLECPQVGSELRRKRRTGAAWRSEGGEVRCRPLWQHATRRQGGARPVCLTQDWIGPTGDTTKRRFGSTKLKV